MISFFKNIYQIIQHYEEQIKQTFTNLEIYSIFENNKTILLFLFENKIIKIDDDIYSKIIAKTEANGNRYCYFFYPEVKEFLGEEKIKIIHDELLSKNSDVFDRFNEKRHEGKNDSYLYSLIRQDSVEEFVSFATKSNLKLTSEVNHSIFETHSFLIENTPTLIEYAAFFGSIQIFQFLRMNNVELKPTIWSYVIHSRNAELIHLLE